jgi:hypothetical protein
MPDDRIQAITMKRRTRIQVIDSEQARGDGECANVQDRPWYRSSGDRCRRLPSEDRVCKRCAGNTARCQSKRSHGRAKRQVELAEERLRVYHSQPSEGPEEVVSVSSGQGGAGIQKIERGLVNFFSANHSRVRRGREKVGGRRPAL